MYSDPLTRATETRVSFAIFACKAMVRWSWDCDPFGTNAPNENPSGLSTFTYNLRLPGQIYDAETGRNYNYFRDYEPTIGRYVESDPVGLKGGLSTYGYVGGNPIRRYDSSGLIWCDDWGWMALDWALGTTTLNRALGNNLPRTRSYGEGTDQVAQLQELPPIAVARERYRSRNASQLGSECCDPSKLQSWTSSDADDPGAFGPMEFAWATRNKNCAWHFTGSFDIAVDPVSCTRARFTVTNVSGRESFFRYLKFLGAKSLPPNATSGVGANLTQTYSWVESF